MHTLIVTAHPNHNSYTQAVIDKFVAGLETGPGNTHEVLNLVTEGFSPAFIASDYQGFYDGEITDLAILAEQKRVDRADLLVLVFPIYWWSMPAVMKGWIDRVFSPGWAFIDDPGKGTTRLLKGLRGQVIAIGGSARRTYDKRGYLDAMKKQIEEGIFGYCGMISLGFELLLPMDETSSLEGLQTALSLGGNIAEKGEQLTRAALAPRPAPDPDHAPCTLGGGRR